MDDIAAAYASQGVEFWAIALMNKSSESAAALESFRDSFGIAMPILMDPDGGTYNALFPNFASQTRFPEEVILDSAGVVVWHNEAFDYDEVTSVLDTLLAGP